ncbi:immunoglobulin superfamily member 10-like isoform X2 [Xenia sp. Carnegie-2017]|nr:immunoglobulin superfamily member 10-like isoform X2 [Xenia sp. Carnegie-2017]
MEKFGFLSFLLFCWISSCQVKMVKTNLVFSTVTLITFLGLAKGTIIPPLDGQKFVFLPGSSHNITWTLNNIGDFEFRSWTFRTFDTPSSAAKEIVRIIDDKEPVFFPSVLTSLGLDVEVFKPATLMLKNVTQSYIGVYKFSIHALDSFGSSVNVSIAIKPNVLINCPTRRVVDEGDYVSCVCRGEGGNPPANVTWFDKDNNIIGDVEVVNKTLVITNVALNDGGNYTCKAQSYNDPRYRDEKSIEIKVKATYLPQQTNITISPMSVKKGQNVTITCESDGYLEPTYTIYHNGAVISNKRTYIIKSVNFSHQGSYRCEAKNKLGNDSSDVKNLTIIKVKPNVEINCSTPLVVDEGDNVSCVCRGEGGIPPANVTWFDKDNNIIGDVGVVSKTLVITNVTLNDGGTYRCKAQSYNDPRFTDEKSIEVTVKATYNVLCDDQKERIKQCKIEWYIILITLTSGIIVGIFVSILFFLRYRQHWLSKKRQQFQSPSEVRKISVDTTYQELDLSKMNNKEDNYQSLRPKDDTIDKTYQELDISKMNMEDNNYESLQKNDESEYVIADEKRNYENSNLF